MIRLILSVGLSVFYACCKPIQLVSPSSDHKSLILNDDALTKLQEIQGPVSVVSVLGTIHSGLFIFSFRDLLGKSHLMNRLFEDYSPTNSFSLGHGVDPETKGIWMIFPPPVINGTSIIVLDTEGLFSAEADDVYDSRLFSLAVLLSSHVFINTVKQIGSHEIEVLEYLSKRAQLFSLKALAFSASTSSSSGEDLLKALDTEPSLRPSLTWVVQDFTAGLAPRHKNDPTNWLNEMLSSSRQANEIDLRKYFKTVTARTLAPPAVSKKHLTRLEKIATKDLDEDYISDLNLLKAEYFPKIIQSSSSRSGKNGLPITSGSQLARTFNLLATAAHAMGNSFEEFTGTSLWDAFAARHSALALKEVEKTVLAALDKTIYNASEKENIQLSTSTIPLKCLSKASNQRRDAAEAAWVLWTRLTEGMAVKDYETSLQTLISRAVETTSNEHERLLKEACIRIGNGELGKLFIALKQLSSPMSPPRLEVVTSNMIADFYVQLANELDCAASESHAHDSAASKTQWCQPKISETICRKVYAEISKNALSEVSVLQAANDRLALGHLVDSVRTASLFIPQEPSPAQVRAITHDQLENHLSALKTKALEAFTVSTNVFKDWQPSFGIHMSALESHLNKGLNEFRFAWQRECDRSLEVAAEDISSRFSHWTDAEGVESLPIDEYALQTLIDEKIVDLLNNVLLKNPLISFCKTEELQKLALPSIKAKTRSTEKLLHSKNIDILRYIVAPVLSDSLQKAHDTANLFWFASRFRAWAIEMTAASVSEARRQLSSFSGKQNDHSVDALSRQVAERWAIDSLGGLEDEISSNSRWLLIRTVIGAAIIFIAAYVCVFIVKPRLRFNIIVICSLLLCITWLGFIDTVILLRQVVSYAASLVENLVSNLVNIFGWKGATVTIIAIMIGSSIVFEKIAPGGGKWIIRGIIGIIFGFFGRLFGISPPRWLTWIISDTAEVSSRMTGNLIFGRRQSKTSV